MGEDALISLASIVVLGIGAQWIGWRLRLPSILLLLLAGFFAGPIAGLINPDHLLGETLFPVVSISVGIILFEGGLTLRLGEIAGVRRVIFGLISVGALITWAVATLGAYFIVGLHFDIALLLGAVFIVSGPTVVIPLLNHVRPRGQVGSILKWEGILIDSVGATIAVLIFEVILTEHVEGHTAAVVLAGLFKTIAVGSVVGAVAAVILVTLMQRYWVPEHLQNPVAVMLIVAAFTLSNEMQAESGLLATTLMGAMLANQRRVSVKHLSQFKEDIGVLLLSSLFVLLAARLDLDSLSNIGIRALGFLILLIAVARPLSVLAATYGSRLTWRERAFMAWLAPRGIVAVSVASLFALELAKQGNPAAEQIVPLTFLIVVGTVTTYSLTAGKLAARLGLAQAAPQGILIVGAHGWARAIARALQATGRAVLLIDTNWDHVSAAKMDGLPAVYASILSEHVEEEVNLNNLGRLLALTANDEVNSLACLRFADFFERANVFQLPLHGGDQSRTGISFEQHGRCLFGAGMTYGVLTERFDAGAVVKTVKLTNEFSYADFRALYNDSAVPLFLMTGAEDLGIFNTDQDLTPRAGHTLVALVDEPAQNTEA